MTFSGSITVLDAPGAVSKQLVKNSFLVPTANDITAAQNLLNMVGDRFTGSQITPEALALVNFGGVTKPIRIAELLQSTSTIRSFFTADDVGMVGDGVTDDSFALQQHMLAQSALGGAVYWLTTPQSGGSFFLKGSNFVPSNITLIWSSPGLLAKGATFRIAGGLAAIPGRDAFRLLEDALSGATAIRVDTASVGGAALSTLFQVGDHLELLGNFDACGSVISRQQNRVTAITDGTATLTLAFPLNTDYLVTYPTSDYETNFGFQAQTIVRSLIYVVPTADLAAGVNLVPIRSQDLGKLAVGDVVLVKDDTLTSDFPGTGASQGVPCGEELAVITANVAGDPSPSVRLDRRVSRPFTTARNFRLIKVNPSVGAVVTGFRALSAEAPDPAPAPRIDWMGMLYAYRCLLSGCVVPNTDQFGKRGTAFEIERSLDCRTIDCDGYRAKFFAAGEGNGVVMDRSTGCKNYGGLFDGMRHSTQCVSGNNNDFYDITVVNPRDDPMDCHGTYEVDCHWHNPNLSGGTQYSVNEGRAPHAVTFGNPTFLAPSLRCGVHGGVATGFKADSGSFESVIAMFPGAVDCVIDDLAISDCSQVFEFQDTAGFGTVISTGHRIKVKVDGCVQPRMVDIRTRTNGATIDTLTDTRIEIYGRNINGGFFAQNCSELEIAACDLDEVTVDPSNSYFVEATACANLKILGNRTVGVGRFLSLQDCPGYRVINNRVLDQTMFSTVFNDMGGNTSGVWQDNVFAGGFLPFWTFNATSSIIIEGRIPGTWDLPDDSVLTIIARRSRGKAVFYSSAGTVFFAEFRYDVISGGVALLSTTTVNVDGSSAALTGTTGVDGRVTVSAVAADDTIRIENRTGAVVRVDGWLM